MYNKVVARFADGHLVKGVTVDFSPSKAVFHINRVDAPDGSPPVAIPVSELKLLAFVYDFAGDPQRHSQGSARPINQADGQLLRVTFPDGEVLEGTSSTYQPGRSGFFLEPIADNANEERFYIPSDSTRAIAII